MNKLEMFFITAGEYLGMQHGHRAIVKRNINTKKWMVFIHKLSSAETGPQKLVWMYTDAPTKRDAVQYAQAVINDLPQ